MSDDRSPARVLDVGNCDFDHQAIRSVIETHFEAQVLRAHGKLEALQALRAQPFQLVLINRIFDRDQNPGMDLLLELKADSDLGALPVMLITNFDEKQAEAVRAGAEVGFGKQRLQHPSTLELLARLLPPRE